MELRSAGHRLSQRRDNSFKLQPVLYWRNFNRHRRADARYPVFEIPAWSITRCQFRTKRASLPASNSACHATRILLRRFEKGTIIVIRRLVCPFCLGSFGGWLGLSGMLIAGLYVFFAIGEFTTPHSGLAPTFVEGTGIALLTATCAGMLVAWRWELTGAIVSLVSLIGFTLLIRANNHVVTVVLAVPGILYILDRVLHRHRTLSPMAGN